MAKKAKGFIEYIRREAYPEYNTSTQYQKNKINKEIKNRYCNATHICWDCDKKFILDDDIASRMNEYPYESQVTMFCKKCWPKNKKYYK